MTNPKRTQRGGEWGWARSFQGQWEMRAEANPGPAFRSGSQVVSATLSRSFWQGSHPPWAPVFSFQIGRGLKERFRANVPATCAQQMVSLKQID